MVLPAVNLPDDFSKAVEIPQGFLDALTLAKVRVAGAEARLSDDGQDIIFHFPEEKTPKDGQFVAETIKKHFQHTLSSHINKDGAGEAMVNARARTLGSFQTGKDGRGEIVVTRSVFEEKWSLE